MQVDLLNVPLKLVKPKIRIHTIQLAKWRLAQRDNVELIDITAKSGIAEFAPDFNNVMSYKRGEMTIPDYSAAYLDKMRNSLREHPQVWKQLTEKTNVAFACYCRAHEFCHRHSFANMAMLYLQSMGMEVELMGEIYK